MIATHTRNKLGIALDGDLRAVMQGKVAIAGEASYLSVSQVPVGFMSALSAVSLLFWAVLKLWLFE
jgi:hypothetical protein